MLASSNSPSKMSQGAAVPLAFTETAGQPCLCSPWSIQDGPSLQGLPVHTHLLFTQG